MEIADYEQLVKLVNDMESTVITAIEDLSDPQYEAWDKTYRAMTLVREYAQSMLHYKKAE